MKRCRYEPLRSQNDACEKEAAKSSSKRSNFWVTILIVVGAISVTAILIALGYFLIKRRKRGNTRWSSESVSNSVDAPPPSFVSQKTTRYKKFYCNLDTFPQNFYCNLGACIQSAEVIT